MRRSIITFSLFAASALGCAQHKNHHYPGSRNKKRDDAGDERDWEYATCNDWGTLSPDYEMCYSGAHQAPINIMPGIGPALSHKPSFNYSGSYEGNFYNWGFGPAFTVSHEKDDYTSNPSFTYDNTTIYLIGWHIHTPADHTVVAHRARAELHLVHVDAEGHPAAVLGIRMEPGVNNSTFIEQLPTPMIHWNGTEAEAEEPLDLNLELALDNVNMFDEYWTYEGSLTTPPCAEGIRWFIARRNLFTSMDQMRSILKASRYGSRAEQPLWMHNVNA